MKPTHPVDLLCCAISLQEGWFSDNSVPKIRKNPGDLRAAGQIGAQPAPAKGTPPIATFDTVGHGVAALYRQVWKYVADGKTVAQLIAIWAPPIENNTTVYLQNVLHWTGLPADIPILELLPPLVKLS